MGQIPAPPAPPPHRWTYDLRRWVVIGLVVAGALFAYFIRETIPLLVLALLVAYLLNPIVTLAARRLKIPRIAAAALTYLVLIAVLIELGILVTPNLARQGSLFLTDFDTLVARFIELGKQLPILANWVNELDAAQVAAQLRLEARGFLEQSPRFIAGAASSVFNVFVVLVLSFYLVKDADVLVQRLRQGIPAAYHDDFDRITGELDEVWSGFLRGQVLLAVIIGAVTTVALTILGVRSALLLGILAGILEVVPTLGPIIAMIHAVFIALFQGSANWPIEPAIFALIVVLVYFGIQQLENHVIVPNVLGASVNLPPVLILAGTLVGASLAGVLGIFLAAPVIATARLFFQFILHKLFEPLPSDGKG
jgi:predicted PurR-regulated permease PerM